MLNSVFDAGCPALTFADRIVLDGVKDYADLVESARQMGLIDPEKAARLMHEARITPYPADAVLAEARILARVIHRIFAALAKGGGPASGDVEFLNGSLARAMTHLALAPHLGLTPKTPGDGPGFAWTWRSNTKDQLHAMLWPVARDAAELLVGQDPTRIRLCAGPACERLFLDKSKAGRRRWCQMETCGNRAKARRYARRQTAARSGAP